MKKNFSTIILILMFFVGLSVLLYPSIANYVNSLHSTKAIINYEAALNTLSPKDYTQEFAKADKYNGAIKNISFPFIYYDRVPGYDDILNVMGNGVIGYITIEKIRVQLPIYHSISAPVLNVGVGHVPGSSLPAGGPGTHTVLSAHRGLPSAKLFTQLDKLQLDDIFQITVLDRVLTYEVDQILIVEPEQVEELYVKEGRDLCTLVTCTPYGINTHRLLVRGHRIETPEDTPMLRVPADAVQIEPVAVAPIVAVPMLLGLLILLLVKYRRKK